MPPTANELTAVHPRADDLRRLRALILAVHPDVRESVKWSAPSYATSDHFCTFNLRGPGGRAHVALILHTGARSTTPARGRVDDPLLTWLADDRARVDVPDAAWIDAHGAALQDLLRRWMALL
jgi:hypothetical protein